DCCSTRLSNFYVFVSNKPFTSNDPTVTQGQAGVSSFFVTSLSGPSVTITVNQMGQYVRVQLTTTNYLSLAEVRVMGTAGSVQNYTIAVSASPSAGGTVSGSGTFAAGSSCTVTATANSGYSFANWTEN